MQVALAEGVLSLNADSRGHLSGVFVRFHVAKSAGPEFVEVAEKGVGSLELATLARSPHGVLSGPAVAFHPSHHARLEQVFGVVLRPSRFQQATLD